MRMCICGERLTTNEQLRRGFCCVECQRQHAPRRAYSVGWGKPNTSLSILGKPAINRKRGRDNRETSE